MSKKSCIFARKFLARREDTGIIMNENIIISSADGELNNAVQVIKDAILQSQQRAVTSRPIHDVKLARLAPYLSFEEQ